MNPKHVSKLGYSALLLLVFYPTAASCFINTDVKPAKLSKQVQRKLEAQSCQKNFNVRAETVTAERNENGQSLNAHIICKPHISGDGRKLRAVFGCHMDGRKWTCARPKFDIATVISGKIVTLRSELSYIDGSLELLKYVSASDNFMSKISPAADGATSNICRVYRFEDATWSIECNEVWGASIKQRNSDDVNSFVIVNEGPVMR